MSPLGELIAQPVPMKTNPFGMSIPYIYCNFAFTLHAIIVKVTRFHNAERVLQIIEERTRSKVCPRYGLWLFAILLIKHLYDFLCGFWTVCCFFPLRNHIRILAPINDVKLDVLFFERGERIVNLEGHIGFR